MTAKMTRRAALGLMGAVPVAVTLPHLASPEILLPSRMRVARSHPGHSTRPIDR